MSGSPRQKVANWNITSSNWLRLNVFEPLVSLGVSKETSQLATNMVSAFWHGLFPCYYLTFLIMNTMVTIEKTLFIKGHVFNFGWLTHFYFDLAMVYFKCYRFSQLKKLVSSTFGYLIILALISLWTKYVIKK